MNSNGSIGLNLATWYAEVLLSIVLNTLCKIPGLDEKAAFYNKKMLNLIKVRLTVAVIKLLLIGLIALLSIFVFENLIKI